jgi:hypothetical protein
MAIFWVRWAISHLSLQLIQEDESQKIAQFFVIKISLLKIRLLNKYLAIWSMNLSMVHIRHDKGHMLAHSELCLHAHPNLAGYMACKTLNTSKGFLNF